MNTSSGLRPESCLNRCFSGGWCGGFRGRNQFNITRPFGSYLTGRGILKFIDGGNRHINRWYWYRQLLNGWLVQFHLNHNLVSRK